MSEEWEELKQVIILNNKGDISEAIKLACTFDLKDKSQLLSAVLSVFLLTPEFVCGHINESYKIINAIHGVEFSSIRDSFRAGYLISIFDSITMKKGDL